MLDTPVQLKLDGTSKSTLENLFVLAAQLPALGLVDGSLERDGESVFRVAKEFALSLPFTETRPLRLEDVLKLLRFICWLLSGFQTPLGIETSDESQTSERLRNLRTMFASIAMQMQSQEPQFEALLKSFGINRQLERQLPPRADDESQEIQRIRQTQGYTNGRETHVRSLTLERVFRKR